MTGFTIKRFYGSAVLLMIFAVFILTPLASADDTTEQPLPVVPQQMGCPVDLVLVLDGSGSVAPDDFLVMKEFVRQLVNAFPISPNDANVGIIQFSDTPELYLEISSDPADIRTALDVMTQFGNRTDIAGAIKLAQEQFLTRRQNLPRVIVVLTDGMHNMGGNPIAQADIARGQGTTIFGIGVGTFDLSELISISGGESNVISVSNFGGLTSTLDVLLNNTCSLTVAAAPPTPEPVVTTPPPPSVTPAPGATAAPTTVPLPTDTPAPILTPTGPRKTQLAFASDRDGDMEIYVMHEDGSNFRQLTSNGAEDDKPAWSKDGKRLAWESNQDGDYEIWVMDANGGNQEQLTSNDARDWSPSWSPDNSRIAFYSNREGIGGIWVMNADGSDPRRITTGNIGEGRSPTWSPDGQQIAYFSDESGGREIYMVDLNNGQQQRLTDNDCYDGQPDWSLSGTLIAFASSCGEQRSDIYVMRTDGSNVRKVIDLNGTNDDPVWSPDGRQIAFESGSGGNMDIWIVNADGTDLRQLTDSESIDWSVDWMWLPVEDTTAAVVPVATQNAPVSVGAPGPGDTQIAFSSDRDGDHEIFVMDGDGANVRQLTFNTTDDDKPDWSRDGRMLAWDSEAGGDHEIWVMNADGSDQRQLTDNAADDWNPAWSPDGSQIAFYSNRNGGGALWLMEADGSRPRSVTFGEIGVAYAPAWSPDGTEIAYYTSISGKREIYVVEINTGNIRQLTNNDCYDGQPKYSPDGAWILFASSCGDQNPDVYYMDVNGGSRTRVTELEGTNDDPAWSPDGRQIVFESGRGGDFNIWIVNLDGTGLRQLTDDPAVDWSSDWMWKP